MTKHYLAAPKMTKYFLIFCLVFDSSKKLLNTFFTLAICFSKSNFGILIFLNHNQMFGFSRLLYNVDDYSEPILFWWRYEWENFKGALYLLCQPLEAQSLWAKDPVFILKPTFMLFPAKSYFHTSQERLNFLQ